MSGTEAVNNVSMLKRMNHMDYLVKDLDQAITKFSRIFGPASLRGKAQGLEFAHFPIGDLFLALVTPGDPETPLGKLMKKRLDEKGEGLWHIGYQVDHIEEAAAALKGHGVRLLNEKPRPGKDSWKLIDIAEEETCGLMIQLVEE